MQQKGSKMQFEALVAVLCALLHNAMCDVSKTHNVTSFHWRPSAWSGCVHRMPLTCCECYRTRRVDCIMVTGGTDVTSGRLVPPFYCRKYASSVLLYGEDGVHGGEVSVAGSVGMEEWGVGEMVVSGGDEAEERQACPACAQDCVLSVWSEWSSCRETCAPTVRQRIRRVLVASSLGGISCDSLGLVNTDDCVNLPHCTIIGPLSRLTPRYSWLAGPWTSCRVAPVSVSSANASGCGTGRRYRHVHCVNGTADVTEDRLCDLEASSGSKPHAEEACVLPCNCQVTSWGAWSECSVTCVRPPTVNNVDGGGYQVRMRAVTSGESGGGVPCPALKEVRPCEPSTSTPCARYVWHVTGWSQCQLIDSRAIRPPFCGAGMQTREVFCRQESTGSPSPVSDNLCFEETWPLPPADNATLHVPYQIKPLDMRHCDVPCARDCELGEWAAWSSCSASCGRSSGMQMRLKPVLVEAVLGGVACSTRVETRQCISVPCFSWMMGNWTTCVPERGSKCGMGYQVRAARCLNSEGDEVEQWRCDSATRPDNQQVCHVPCPSQCAALTSWTEWSRCSSACGVPPGVQYRSRSLRDIGPRNGTCPLTANDLNQTRSCNWRPCVSHYWQVAAWSTCVTDPASSAACGQPDSGLQTRDVWCQAENGETVNNSSAPCDVSARPVASRACVAACMVDCRLSEWSQWSECGGGCGEQARRSRYRTVQTLAQHGGVPCPAQALEHGLVTQTRACRNKACFTVSWLTSPWSQCRTMTADCGVGWRSRNVTCVASDERTIAEDHCMRRGAGPAPVSHEACTVPCPGDCLLTPWSPFGPCSQTCGSVPGSMLRSRSLADPVPILESGSDVCGHVTAANLTEVVPCGHTPCPSYEWEVGDWGSCIISQSSGLAVPSQLCGGGIQRRHVLCQRLTPGDRMHVPLQHCDAVVTGPMPDNHRSCLVPCARDCQMSSWSLWSNCSQPCGKGVMTRQRGVVSEAEGGGRPCGELEERAVCQLRQCEDFEWSVGEWSECVLPTGGDCGHGEQTRTVTCPSELTSDCEMRRPRPADKSTCDKPCRGECVLSHWSEFSRCRCTGRHGREGHQVRTRTVLSKPKPWKMSCGQLEEMTPCQCDSRYTLVDAGWSSCQPLPGSALCSQGIRTKMVSCLVENKNSSPLPVVLSYCDLGINVTSQSESCEPPCPGDCVLSDYEPWGVCTKTCGVDAFRIRKRKVIQRANAFGRPCPDKTALIQNTTCHTAPCYSYSWMRGVWKECSVSPDTCGMGVRSRTVSCTRNDDVIVDDIICLQREGLQAEKLDDLKKKEREELDLHTRVECGVPCAGDCVVTEWSEFGPCFSVCHQSSRPRMVRVRTRAILQQATSRGQQCPHNTIDTKSCPEKEAICPVFVWKPSDWSSSGRRRVHCVSTAGERVDESACDASTKPAVTQQCTTPCASFSTCSEGVCRCQSGFQLDSEGQCLPLFGCLDNSHCVINGSECNKVTKECTCTGGQQLTEELQCPANHQQSQVDEKFIYVPGITTAMIAFFALIGIVGVAIVCGLFIVIGVVLKLKSGAAAAQAASSKARRDERDEGEEAEMADMVDYDTGRRSSRSATALGNGHNGHSGHRHRPSLTANGSLSSMQTAVPQYSSLQRSLLHNPGANSLLDHPGRVGRDTPRLSPNPSYMSSSSSTQRPAKLTSTRRLPQLPDDNPRWAIAAADLQQPLPQSSNVHYSSSTLPGNSGQTAVGRSSNRANAVAPKMVSSVSTGRLEPEATRLGRSVDHDHEDETVIGSPRGRYPLNSPSLIVDHDARYKGPAGLTSGSRANLTSSFKPATQHHHADNDEDIYAVPSEQYGGMSAVGTLPRNFRLTSQLSSVPTVANSNSSPYDVPRDVMSRSTLSPPLLSSHRVPSPVQLGQSPSTSRLNTTSFSELPLQHVQRNINGFGSINNSNNNRALANPYTTATSLSTIRATSPRFVRMSNDDMIMDGEDETSRVSPSDTPTPPHSNVSTIRKVGRFTSPIVTDLL